MNRLKVLSMFVTLLLSSMAHAQKHPQIFDISEVVFGAQRLPTLYLYAAGAWSDASEMENALSVQIECYKRIEFCSVAGVIIAGEGPGSIGASLDGFDILRWDDREMIAVDNSPICVVNTIRADFVAKTISISSAKKGAAAAEKDALCKYANQTTAFLVDNEEVTKKILQKPTPKK